jgi:hypothetical protein
MASNPINNNIMEEDWASDRAVSALSSTLTFQTVGK